jgi:adenosylmethionine-8-amino-7-oxononanoate aminotransferase
MQEPTIAELDRRHVLHSWSVNENYQGVEVSRAEGCYFWDTTGKRYFDLSAQLLCVNAGHGQRKILDGIRDQLEKLCYVTPGHVSEPRARLAAMLAERAPGDLEKVFFTTSGAEANENAVKMARLYTGRHKIVTRYRSFHGASYGAMSFSGDPRHLDHATTTLHGVVHVQDPFCYRCPFKLQYPSCETWCADHVRQVVELEGPNTIAAILMEPITGTNGIIIPPGDYWPKIRKLCDDYGIVLIADEVMTGFGRTGRWFGIENFGVAPDMITCAKGVTSAYVPLGAVIVSRRITDVLDKRVLSCGATYSGHPLACAAGVATLEFYEEEKVFENCLERSKTFLRRLDEMKRSHRSVGDVRGMGLFGCIELVRDKATRVPLVPFNASGAALAPQNQIKKWLGEEGLFTFVRWNQVYLSPPLVVTEEELNDAFDRLERVLARVDSELL